MRYRSKYVIIKNYRFLARFDPDLVKSVTDRRSTPATFFVSPDWVSSTSDKQPVYKREPVFSFFTLLRKGFFSVKTFPVKWLSRIRTLSQSSVSQSSQSITSLGFSFLAPRLRKP
jgi:hypothetical protein